MSYETLDAIADAYNPLLLIAIAMVLIRQWRQLAWAALTLLAYMGGVYGLMWLDNVLVLWPSAGLDYSTHTAFATVCAWFLWRSNKTCGWRWMWVISVGMYFALMLYQQYHTWQDVLSTLTVIVAWTTLVDHLTIRLHKGVRNENSGSSQNPACERCPYQDHQK